MNTKVLKDKQAQIASDMRALNAKAEAEKRGFTADEEQSWNAMRADFEALDAAIKRAEFDAGVLSKLDEQTRRYVTDANGNPVEMGKESRKPDGEEDRRGSVKFCGKEVRSEYSRTGRVTEPAALNEAFDGFLRKGAGGISAEHRALIEARAQSVGTPSAGGYTVPTDFANTIEIALKSYSGIRNAATVLQTADGRSLPWPTVNDTTTSGALIAENAGDTEGAVTFGQVTFSAYTFTSKIVLVSMELLQDTGIDLGAVLGNLLGARLGRGTAAYYATGTGSSQPQGLITGATLGKTAASATAVTYQEMLDLKHSVDPAYRNGGKWIMHDAILAVVKQLKDTTNRPIWQPNIAQAVPATIDGDAYVTDQGMASAMTTTQKIMAYGDLSKFMIRDVLGFQLVVLRELYAANRQVGFNMFMRTDSRLLDAGTRPVKFLALA